MQNIIFCVIGHGYVGLPLARLFSTKYKSMCTNFDTPNSSQRN